ncbi:MAG: exonuclease domain-containing protein [Candidatus Planktophila sp.]
MSALEATDEDLSSVTFVVLDLETSGASPQTGSAITEIGAVKVCGGQIIGTFKTFVNPGTPIPSFITELTGITDEMLQDAPRIESVLPLLFEFLGSEKSTVFVAHNAPFDLSFLRTSAALHGYTWPNFRVIDTVKAARFVLTKDDVANYQLATLASYFRTEITPNHRALDDALATMDVLHGIIERMGSYGISTINQMMNARAKKERSNNQRRVTTLKASQPAIE